MRTPTCCRAACAFFLFALGLALPSRAEIIGQEQFDYANGSIANQTGGRFWDHRNRVASGHTGNVSDWDNSTGAPTVSLGRLVTNNSSARREWNGPGEGLPTDSDEGLGAINNFSNSTISFQQHVVYIRVTVTTGATVPAAFTITSSDFGTDRVSFGVTGFFANDLRFSIRDHATGAVFSSFVAVPNTSYQLVAKLDFVAGKATLYGNPDLNAPENTQTPIVGPTDFTTSFWSTSVRLGSGAGGAVTWDDLFVATTWAELGTLVTTEQDEDDGPLGGGTGVSLREAVMYSPSGRLITFAPFLSGQTIALTRGALTPPAGTTTIDASGLPRGLRLDGNGTARHFFVGANSTLNLTALTLTRGGGDGGNSGGSIFVNDGQLSLSRCTLADNRGADGGAIWQQGTNSDVRLERCTVTGNASNAGGSTGGIAALNGSCRLTACTISGNAGQGTGGGLYLETSTVVLEGCVIAGNSDPTANDIYFFNGTLLPGGANLIGSNATVASFFLAGPLAGIQAAPLNPRLSPLGFFGGTTPTMHPLVGSPAIDAGGTANPGGTDQRGYPRFVDGNASAGAQLDLGAVEAGPQVMVTSLVDGLGADLRSTIANASAPGTHVVFFPGASTFPLVLLNGEIAVGNRSVFLDASDQASPVTITGQKASRHFSVGGEGVLAVQNLTLTAGQAPGGTFGGRGGNGGAILNDGGSLSVLASTVRGNAAGDGTNVPDGSPDDGGAGGAIFSSGRALIAGSTLDANHAGHTDGAFTFGGKGGAIANTGTLIVTGSTLRGNASGDGYLGGDGGGIYSRGTAFIADSTLDSNAAGSGEAIQETGPGRGGGIYNSGTLRIVTSTVSRNQAGFSYAGGGQGGGIYNKGSAVVSLCTITGNACGIGIIGPGGGGGGIFGENNRLEVANCTITGNFASEGGGGNGQGGGIFQGGSAFFLRHSIVTKNFLRLETTGGTSETNLAGAAPTATGNLLSGDPKLAPLSDYGGPTFTMLPLPGSPALNAAINSTALFDQRGLRPNGLPDIGAVEIQPALVGFVDTDNDGMDDRLEPLYGFVVGVQDGALDADGDGSLNRDELGNKTGPRDLGSLLKITAFSRVGNTLQFTWTSFPGLSYDAEYSIDNITFGNTVFVGTANGMTMSQTIGPIVGNSAFLRIRRK